MKITKSQLCLFSIHQNCIKKVHKHDVEFLSIEVTSNKARRNYVNFLPTKIMPKNVSRNDVDFLPIEITSKKVRENEVDIHRVFPFDVTT